FPELQGNRAGSDRSSHDPFDADQQSSLLDVAQRDFRLSEIPMLHPSRLARGVLRVVPSRLTTHVVTTVVNHLLRGQPIAERLGELSGRSFCMHVDDVPVGLTFEIASAGLRASNADPHVTMRG